MRETFIPSCNEIQEMCAKTGYSLFGHIEEVYELKHKDRLVIRVGNKILKFRPDNDKALEEYAKMVRIYSSYQYHGGVFALPGFRRLKNDYCVIEMDYLGVDLRKMSETLDLRDNNSTSDIGWFNGFDMKHVIELVETARRAHYLYSRDSNEIHGDLYDGMGVNNLVYNRHLDRLLLVDGEALAPVDEARLERFHRQMDDVKVWMMQNLTE